MRPTLGVISISPSGKLIVSAHGIYHYLDGISAMDEQALDGVYECVELTRNDMDFENMCREAWRARLNNERKNPT